MTAPAQEPEVKRSHDLDFTPTTPWPLGYRRCKACGYWVNAYFWASETCSEPTRKEEK